MIKSLYLSFDEKEFKLLKKIKEEYEKKANAKISWEAFVFWSVNK